MFYGTSPNSFTAQAEGVATSYAVDFTPLKRGISYASPVLHHVLLKGKGLNPSTLSSLLVTTFWIHSQVLPVWVIMLV